VVVVVESEMVVDNNLNKQERDLYQTSREKQTKSQITQTRKVT
jgi:hypothetical protein